MPLDSLTSLPQRESTEDFFNNLIRPTFEKINYENCSENEQLPMPAIAESVDIEELSPSRSSLKSSIYDDEKSVSNLKDFSNDIPAKTNNNHEVAAEKLDQSSSHRNNIPVKRSSKIPCKLLPLLILPILAYGVYFLVAYLSKVFLNLSKSISDLYYFCVDK